MSATASLQWTENGADRHARFRSEAGLAPPRRVQLADDTLDADTAYRLACEGTGLLWRGDFHNARQLLQALARRADRKPRRVVPASAAAGSDPGADFYRHRQTQGQRARVLAMVLLQMEPDYTVALRRAPDVRQACTEAWGAPGGEPCVVSLRELQALIGAHEWRKKGVEIAALGAPPHNRIHPHFGVFSPVRGEYLDLVAQAPLPSRELAFDVGTGTGVVAAVLARRGVQRVVATELDARALDCARDNLSRLELGGTVQLLQTDLFPPGRAPLVVCNPPWLPARPSAPVERAIYDEGSRMLKGFLAGLGEHLDAKGEGWLVLSDLAEQLGLRSRADLLAWIQAGGLQVIGRLDVRPRHGKAADTSDPLHAARSRETTSLWRLTAA